MTAAVGHRPETNADVDRGGIGVPEGVGDRLATNPVDVGANERRQRRGRAAHGDHRSGLWRQLGGAIAKRHVERPALEWRPQFGEARIHVGRSRLELNRGAADRRLQVLRETACSELTNR